jgi:hypothetical protein
LLIGQNVFLDDGIVGSGAAQTLVVSVNGTGATYIDTRDT